MNQRNLWLTHSDPIDIILGKNCIKFIWDLIHSNHILFNNIIKFSLLNMSNAIKIYVKCGTFIFRTV